ncbi:MAG: TatD family hydrolase [Lachnospiraceae bacterium]|nr:TatD family hydrolase [Lachnospiraceae bacterium]
MIFDTHAHYDDEAYNEDRDELIKSLPENGVSNVVNISATLGGIKESLKLSEKYDMIYAALGVHPEGISELSDDEIKNITKLCIDNAVYSGGKVAAVGEIGLDHSYEDLDRALQVKWFEAQLDMAKKVNLPVVIHSRDAAEETYEVMKSNKCEDIGGIVHCFSYSKEMAKKFLDMGFYIGVGGVLTFKNARKLVEACEYIPLENIVLETDCPYLCPSPFRGQRNDSTMIKYVSEKLGEIKNLSPGEVEDITELNARRVYRL